MFNVTDIYFAGLISTQALAALSLSVSVFFMVLAIVSQNNGAKAYERIHPAVSLGVRYGWVMSTMGVSAFLLFAEYFSSLLTSDPIVIEQTALYLRVSRVASYAFVVIFIYIAMLQGIGKPAVIMPVSIYRQVLAPIVVFTVLAWFGLAILSLWIGLDLIIFSSALFCGGMEKRKCQSFTRSNDLEFRR